MRYERIKEVELGIWPIIAAIPAFIASTVAVAAEVAIAAVPYVGAAATVDSIIKTMQHPGISSVEIPGSLGMRGFETSVAVAVQEARADLEELHARELALAKEQEAIVAEAAKKEELTETIKKIAPYVIIGGVGLGAILLLKRRTI